MPSAAIDFTWAGAGALPESEARAGTRLSSTSVVFPEPDTPVTTVRRPFGSST